MLRVKKLKTIQEKVAKEAKLEGDVQLAKGTRIVGFDCAVMGKELICAAAVIEYPSMKIIERKAITKEAPLPYLPTLFAFREGPLILELYYNLESDPQILMVDGHGAAHPDKCGLATYVGVELHQPTIGVAKSVLAGDIQEQNVVMNGAVVGAVVKTKEHAKELIVSPGHLLDVQSAAEIVKQLVVPPHKLPEPLHLAHRLASKERKKAAKP